MPLVYENTFPTQSTVQYIVHIEKYSCVISRENTNTILMCVSDVSGVRVSVLLGPGWLAGHNDWTVSKYIVVPLVFGRSKVSFLSSC